MSSPSLRLSKLANEDKPPTVNDSKEIFKQQCKAPISFASLNFVYLAWLVLSNKFYFRIVSKNSCLLKAIFQFNWLSDGVKNVPIGGGDLISQKHALFEVARK